MSGDRDHFNPERAYVDGITVTNQHGAVLADGESRELPDALVAGDQLPQSRLEEPPCCDSEANSCCFMLYPPSMCEICFVLTWFTDTACFEQFNGRDICEFIFEPPKM